MIIDSEYASVIRHRDVIRISIQRALSNLASISIVGTARDGVYNGNGERQRGIGETRLAGGYVNSLDRI